MLNNSTIQEVGMFVNIKDKYYGKRLALKDIQLNFRKGTTNLIIGTSGAGKSTLVKCIIGAARFNGSISDYKMEDIGYVPQFPALNTAETAEDALFWSALFSNRYPSRTASRQAAHEILDMMGLTGEKDRQIKDLSGGQKQRVSVAKELIRKKDIIIADEIDTGLDAGVSRILIRNLSGITHTQKKTTIVISHNLSNMSLYDNVVVLVRDSKGIGRIAYSGHVDSMTDFFDAKDYVDVLVRLNSPREGGLGLSDAYIRKFNALKRRR